MHNLVTALSLPQRQVPVFSGEVSEYRNFAAAFDSRVHSQPISSSDKLYYLNQHLSEARELIECCLFMHADDGYKRAREILDREFGDPYKVSMIYLKQVQEWQAIKPNDAQGLKPGD